jgi:hypothetical protein
VYLANKAKAKLPVPEKAVTNLSQYMAWRRRALYAVMPALVAVFIEQLVYVVTAWEKFDQHGCHSSDSFSQCDNRFYAFLTMNESGDGMKVYETFALTVGMVGTVFSVIAIRLAATRSADWHRSRRWLLFSWLFPFACGYIQFFVPLEAVFGINYDERGQHAQMIPRLTADVDSDQFDMCTAWGMCEGSLDVHAQTSLLFSTLAVPGLYPLIGTPEVKHAFGLSLLPGTPL